MRKILFVITIIALGFTSLPTHPALAAEINLAAGATLTIVRGAITPETTLNIIFTGDGSLIKQGAGTLILTGANTYTGDTEINGGTLVLGSNYTVNASATFTVDIGATLTNNATLINNATLGVNGTVINNGLIYGPVAASFAGMQTLILDANGGAETIKVAESSTTFDLAKLTTYSKNPTRRGYKLVGWNTAADGSGTPVTGSYNFAGGDTIYAQWTPLDDGGKHKWPPPDYGRKHGECGNTGVGTFGALALVSALWAGGLRGKRKM